MKSLEMRDKCMKSELEDIRYNFVVGRDAMIFEGRGWDHPGVLEKGSRK